MKRAAVFGGSGKLGRRVIAVLEKCDFAIRALVHRTPLSGRNLESVSGDIADPRVVESVARDADVVVQMASAKEDPATFFDVSIRGTFNVLEACRNQRVRQFILFGGDAALGIWFYPHSTPLAEDHPRAAYPGNYAFSKVMEEVMTEQYAKQYSVPYTVLRSSWVFDEDDVLKHFSLLHNVKSSEAGHGFGEIDESVLSMVRAQLERVPLLRDRKGVPLRRHVVHIDDVMQAFALMLEQPAALNQTFNIAGPAAFDYREAAEYISHHLGVPMLDLHCPHFHSFEINTQRARTVLGYAPENDIYHMIDRAIEFRRSRLARTMLRASN